MKKILLNLLLVALALGRANGAETQKHVLVFTKAAGYEHAIVYRDTAWPSFVEKEFLKMADEYDIDFTFTKDGAFFTPENIAKFDAFVFYTSGDLTDQPRNGLGDNYTLMSPDGRSALLQAIREGKGFIGIHSAIDTFTGIDSNSIAYHKMLGANFIKHGKLQRGQLLVADRQFPGMTNVPADFGSVEEWHIMEHFATNLHVLLTLNCTNLDGDLYRRANFPVAWTRTEGQGRVFFTSLGHAAETWTNSTFREMLAGGIRWASRTINADITPNLSITAPQANTYGKLPATDSHLKRVISYIEDSPIPAYQHPSDAAVEAFRDMKFGVRIHWGIYAMLGDASWPLLGMSNAQRQQYQQHYKIFDPTNFNADAWMQLFSTNGVKMFAFTTKHHDGFSMFNTQTRVTNRVNWIAPGGPQIESCDLHYSIMETPFHRDIVKELTDASHRYGLKIDLYFSNPDWYDANFRPYAMDPLRAKSVNAYGGLPDEQDPKYTKNITTAPDPTPEETARMVARHRAQLIELLSNYGQIDMVCLDQWLGPKVWPELRETILQARQLQPNVMLRARGIGNYGDYYTPEDFIPGSKENTAMPWMVIHKLAGTWTYQPDLKQYKDAAWIIQNLADITAKGGNFMIGIGPDDTGKFHPKVIQLLQEAGAWLKFNGEAIYATRPRNGDFWKEGDDIRFTRSKDNRFIYTICLKPPGKTLTLKTVQAKAGSQVTLLGTGQTLAWHADNGLVIDMPSALPHQLAYAFRIEGEDCSN